MKTIKIIYGVLLFSLVLILAKNQFEKRLLLDANYGIPALIEQGETEVLFIGSSMFRQGIDAEVLGQTGENWYVLSYNGNQPVIEEMILQQLIDADVKIGTMFVDMYAYSACAEPALSDEKIAMELDISGKWEMWKRISHSADTGPSAFWRLFVTGNNELLLTWPLYYTLVNQLFQNGGRTLFSDGLTAEQISALEVPETTGELQEDQRKAIQDLIRTAQEYGISIVFIETPKYIAVAEDENYRQVMVEYRELLEEEGAMYVLAEDLCPELCLQPANFGDMVHLSSQGSAAYTEALIDYFS